MLTTYTLPHDMAEPKVRHDSIAESCTSTSSSTGEDSPSDRDRIVTGVWSREEHAKFLEAIKIYANCPWKVVAAYVGTRTVRQTMTHAQKYRQKAARRLRGLRTRQALQRMNHGHQISEESLMQERLRALERKSPGLSLSISGLISPRALFVLDDETKDLLKPFTRAAAGLENEDDHGHDGNSLCIVKQEIVDDCLNPIDPASPDKSPSLEECAEELLELLF